jgi:WD40 repeat protein
LPGIVAFDVQTEKVKSTVYCHEEDVNAVTFLDEACNLIVTGSDDSNLFVYDRCAFSWVWHSCLLCT